MTISFQKARSPLGRPANRRSPIIERFWAKVRLGAGTSCWEWEAHRQPSGYGQFSENQVVVYAHRWAYERFVGPIPEGMHLDHLCRNTRCVNPNHLEPVTQAENNRRAAAARKGVLAWL